jgi:hypothetical protein
MRKLLFAGVAIGALSSSGAAWAQFDLFPNFGQDTAGPSLLFTYTDSGSTTTSNPAYGTAAHPYDGAEDTYFGVINNSGAPITTIPLTSSLDIAGFDGDGIDAYGAPSNAMDSTGYGGPNAFFTNINPAGTAVTVNFITPLAAHGGTGYFSLEEAVSIHDITPGVPEASTWAMMLFGFAGLCFVRYRKYKSNRVALTS